MTRARVPGSVALTERYRVNQTTGCWVFLGSIDDEGYGRIGSRMAHRVMYEALVGAVENGLQLDHLCVRRNCVNPAHLEPVTPEENQRRANEYRAPAAWTGDACRRGHTYTPENTRERLRSRPNGTTYRLRECITCERIRKGRSPLAA